MSGLSCTVCYVPTLGSTKTASRVNSISPGIFFTMLESPGLMEVLPRAETINRVNENSSRWLYGEEFVYTVSSPVTSLGSPLISSLGHEFRPLASS